MRRLRTHGPLILITLLGMLPGRSADAQIVPTSHETAALSLGELPNAPGEQAADSQSSDPRLNGNISGSVWDAKGAEVAGAFLTLEIKGSKEPRTLRTMMTSGDGSFKFDTVDAGTYRLKVASPGFSNWVSAEFVVLQGQSYEMPPVTLQIATANTNVDVVFTQHDLAEEQIKLQEKQRVLGVIPNFYVSYVWNAAPLTTGQKYKLALRSEIDPISFAGAAFVAGIEQGQNDFRGYGEGAKGYFTRMGAAYGDGFNSTIISGAILPSIFHQDPRYFYKGTGTIRSRMLYAIAAVAICKGDNGRWQPNYSFVLGNFASGALSNSYYPPANRGIGLTLVNATITTASAAAGNLFQEFLIKKISRGVQP
jgi:Carboxypeptidase regulatory-like domain